MKKELGQSLSEYLLLAFLIALASMGALSFFANDFSSALPDLIDRTFNGGGGAGGASSSGGGSGSGSGSTASLPSSVATVDITMTTAAGTTLSFSNYPTNLQEAVETAGGNGTTNVLLGNLDSIIQQLEASGELDATQINLLKDFADQGHVLAEYQKMAESFDQAVADSGASSYSDYYATTGMTTINGGVFDYSGSGYLAAGTFDLSGSEGITGGLHVSSNMVDLSTLSPVSREFINGSYAWTVSEMGTFPIAGDEAGQFISLYQDLQSQGVLNDPALKQLVTALGNDIIDVTGNQRDALTERQFSDDLALIPFNESGMSLTSDSSASEICAAGGAGCT